MARSKAVKKPKTANECRMRAECVEGGNKRTHVNIGNPFFREDSVLCVEDSVHAPQVIFFHRFLLILILYTLGFKAYLTLSILFVIALCGD